MPDYNVRLAEGLSGIPYNVGALDELKRKNLLNPKAFNEMQKMRLLEILRKNYLRRGQLSPLERFGQSSASRLAQVDE